MSRRRYQHRPSLAALALLLLAPLPALAQQPIRLGQTVTSELTTADPRVSATDSSYYKTFVYHGRGGEAVRVTMKSAAFDAFLSAGSMQGSQYRMAAMNDDGAGGTDAQLNYVFPADGDLVIRANSVNVATGAFTLAVEAGTPPGPVVDHPITVGQTVRGTLTERSPQEGDATFYEQYTFTGRAGQTVRVTMRSSDVDAYLTLWSAGAGGGSLARDDDGAGGNDAQIVFTLPTAGRYSIHANTLARATGNFELSLAEGAAPAPAPGSMGGNAGGGHAHAAAPAAGSSMTIRAGQTVSGALAESDARAADGSYYDDYVYHAQGGERLVITLRSSAFDAYLTAGTAAAPGGMGSDDDGAGGSDSRLEVTLTAPGDYVIRANSLQAASTGAYTLQVEKQ